MMEFKDYYAALGVAPDADEQAIKQAYRKLARQYHPDVNPGDTQAEERFKEINEAYQALSDPERRRKYDELREQYQRWQQRGGRGDFNWGRREPAAGEQTYTYNVSPEDLEDIFGDGSPFSDFFSSIYGQAAGGPTRGAREVRPRRGRDIEATAEITLEEAFRGTTRSIQVGERRIEARIPPGVRTGSRVRLAGQGSPGIAGGPAGDLYLNIEVAPHPQFERDGDDLRVTVPVDIYTAATGGEARVPTLDGAVMLKIPPRTQADRVFRVKGKGMPRPEKPAERGDLYARVKLTLPEPLSDSELETLRQLAQARRGERVTR
jgi:curved DNA-binding protein